MQLQKSERPHIAFFGCTNSGKSSLVNAITNQQISVVSDIKGTTTDPVMKSMELLPIGPVVIIDTAGIDDSGALGELRINKTKQVLDKVDFAILVIDAIKGKNSDDEFFIKEFEIRKIPYIEVYNKSDLVEKKDEVFYVSAKTREGVEELKNVIAKSLVSNKQEKFIIREKLQAGDIIILVIPIDESAPKGRIILPQQNVLREILDAHATGICVQVEELKSVLEKITPKFIITDSQVFNQVKNIVPATMILTSFSILMANYKGELATLIKGAKTLDMLTDGDKILISEGCTHHRQCNDIGTVKLPNWIKQYTGKSLEFEFTQGGEFPQDLGKYRLVVHCGGCMLNEVEMKSRLKRSSEQNIPIVNYGMAIAYMNGILERSLEIFERY